MKLITRSAWGARYGRGPTNITPQNGGVAVHYVGAGKLATIDHSKCAGRVRSIESDHKNGNGWAGIAYNFLACHHGYVFEGRGLRHRSAAQGSTSGNQNWYAVCALIGAKDTPDDTLKGAIRDAIDYCDKNGAGSRVTGHRDHNQTSCPGDPLYKWVKAGAPRPGSPEPDPTPPIGAKQWPGTYYQLKTPMMRGSNVKWVQERLNTKGANPKLDVDGVFGSKTDREVRDYQNARGLEVDGIVGKLTWASLTKP